jgi:hypothetical protein
MDKIDNLKNNYLWIIVVELWGIVKRKLKFQIKK